MSDHHEGRSRRDVLAAMGGLSVAGAVGPAMAAPVLITPVGPADEAVALRAETGAEATATAVIDTLEGAYGAHRGQRRNHTKGIGALGTFVGLPEGATYSRSALFSGQTIEVVARFSLAGGDPQASDTEKSPRGLGLEFRLPNGALHHMTMIHTPMFFAAVPRLFSTSSSL